MWFSKGSLKPEGRRKKLPELVLMLFIINDHIRATDMSKITLKMYQLAPA